MNPIPLNYCTHAIEDFTRLIKVDLNSENDPLMYPERKHNLDYLAEFFLLLSNLLDDAIKFTLPDNGRLMDPDNNTIITSNMLELLMLPYPIVALEYSAPDLNDRLAYNNKPSDKRISLALDFNKINQKYKVQMLKLMPTINADICAEMIAVFSIYHGVNDGWSAAPGCNFVNRQSTFDAIVDENKKTFMRVSGLLPSPLDILTPNDPKEEFNKARQSLHNDTIDEVIALVEFCAIMNCSNVETQTIKASEKLNKKRAISGKFKLYDFHVLMLSPLDDKSATSSNGNGTHASPRMHLRRGHIRRLSSTKVKWINATVVGNKKDGVIDKSYVVKGQS